MFPAFTHWLERYADSQERTRYRHQEIKDFAHRGEKDGSVSFWLQPSAYCIDEFHEAWDRVGVPIKNVFTSTILGDRSFINQIREKHLDRKKSDRDLPDLKQFYEMPDIEKTIKQAAKVLNEEAALLKRVQTSTCQLCRPSMPFTKCTELDRLKKNIQLQISTLEQYRRFLIYECVTGKRRVNEDPARDQK